MKKFLLLTSLAGLVLTGCATKETSLPESKVFINNTDFSKLNSLKTGEACERYFFYILRIGNKLTAKQAALNNNISKIEYQETSKTIFWPFYYSKCIKVYGE